MRARQLFIGFITSTALACSAAGVSFAQNVPALSLELNAMQPSEKGCRLIFVIHNALGAALSKATFEMVLFERNGAVERITALDFKDLADGKTKVSRFELQGLDCAKVGRILVNEISHCVSEGIAQDACFQGLKLSSRTDIVFGM